MPIMAQYGLIYTLIWLKNTTQLIALVKTSHLGYFLARVQDILDFPQQMQTNTTLSEAISSMGCRRNDSLLCFYDSSTFDNPFYDEIIELLRIAEDWMTDPLWACIQPLSHIGFQWGHEIW